ncbi:P-loop containing nucleoside triphosphate hydrolase protein [Gonapodya prolifera JEL478]|uniref:p-loop containing nucleoside triphosphate hydrolase protein n=1 Tax=Gonapodya prolifera (strain JEL478) TaxID=1344416 RepID=A0A139AIH0_GONPJ|nr:P-loop containing nucleoside triphosphate hydrolase protein [Gonapodya prolifera JEL478]|eukprot:KXS16606.1 P-loop containing nucleoside triphosphate hydrolase protein [Gonapodya prolifera JEL478]
MLGKNGSVSPDDGRKKIVVAGNAGVGKTSLLTTASGGKFPETKYLPAVFSRDYAISRTIDGDQAWVTFVDMDPPVASLPSTRKTALQDGMNAHAVLICFAVGDRKSFSDVQDTWAELVKVWKDSGLPVLLAGLKADARGEGAVTREEANALAESIGAAQYFEVSAKAGEGVSEVIEQIIRAAIPILDRKARGGKPDQKEKICLVM